MLRKRQIEFMKAFQKSVEYAIDLGQTVHWEDFVNKVYYNENGYVTERISIQVEDTGHSVVFELYLEKYFRWGQKTKKLLRFETKEINEKALMQFCALVKRKLRT